MSVEEPWMRGPDASRRLDDRLYQRRPDILRI